jgi:hypothetical protein
VPRSRFRQRLKLGVPRIGLEEMATRLQDEDLIEIGAPIDGLPGTWLVWKE